MAHHLSAERQARRSVVNRGRNKHYMSMMKTALKRVKALKEKEKAATALKRAVKLLDQLAAKGLIHRNKAANQKSKLTKYVSSLS